MSKSRKCGKCLYAVPPRMSDFMGAGLCCVEAGKMWAVCTGGTCSVFKSKSLFTRAERKAILDERRGRDG